MNAPIESRVLRGPDDLETFEWAPGKWFHENHGITGMKVFTPTGPVKAEWGDTIHHVAFRLWFVNEVDWNEVRRANASHRARLAPRCESCGAFTDRDWHDEQVCRSGKGCRWAGAA